MGFFYWGEENNPKRKEAKKALPPERTISTSSLHYGHRPDKRGERRDRYANQPIDVTRSGRVLDGNDRLYYARQRGQRSIRARIWGAL